MDSNSRNSRRRNSSSRSHPTPNRSVQTTPNSSNHAQISAHTSSSRTRSRSTDIPSTRISLKNTKSSHQRTVREIPSKVMDINAPIPRSKGKRSKSLSDRNTTTTAQSKSFSIKQERVTNFLNSSNKNSHVRIISEKPFIISINTAQMNFPRKISNTSQKRLLTPKSRTKESIDKKVPTTRSSGRSSGRKRKHYVESLRDTDDDDLLIDSDNEDKVNSKLPKKLRARDSHACSAKVVPSEKLDKKVETKKSHISINPPNVSGGVGLDPFETESPPPGVLNTLWYSRECFNHVYAIEKILGWKTRTITKLSYKPMEPLKAFKLNPVEQVGGLSIDKAIPLSEKMANELINDPKKRMERSRINGANCPVVLEAAASLEENRSSRLGNTPDFFIETNKALSTVTEIKKDREEVILIKWRGRSYLHCSWERSIDLEKFDPTINTAKGKIKRFYQNQESLMGLNWKKELENSGVSTIVGHSNSLHGSGGQSEQPEEDIFPSDYLEIESIMACDENEMDMTVLSKQRALNFKEERNAVKKREQDMLSVDGHIKTDYSECCKATNKITIQAVINEDQTKEESWDPEDNVRYVVKWKGLQVSECTWEYWSHIKYDAVDIAEDFWYRQKCPSLEEAKILSEKLHPHMREYKKLVESPVFGLSLKERPVAELEDESPVLDKVEEDDGSSAISLRLRIYQLEGVNWLLWNWWNKRSCILADEMGLGKTIQSMAFLDQLHSLPTTKTRGPYLVISPLSLVNQWQSESKLWAPDLNTLLYHGSMDARDYLVKHEFYYSDQFVSKTTATKLKRLNITKFHVLITTYEVAMKDIAVLSKIKWKAMIVDEAHRLKNDQSRLFNDLANIPRDFCLLLTGTPLQNSTEELWSLLNFSDPVLFRSKEDFVVKFGQLTDSKQVRELHSVLKPYLLRRVKEDVEKSLPPKVETILEVTLTPIQKTYYKAIYEKNTAFLFKGSKPSNAPSLMNIMMELRKCCNHPFLIKGAEERILADAGAKENAHTDEDSAVRWYELLADQLVKSSGKMVLLMKLLPKLQSGGHKVLIFSQMVRVLDLLEELMRLKKYRYERLDGSTASSSRAAAVDRFNKKHFQRFVMLLSTRAGGLGLNLTSADTVIIFDSDWNPQNDLQAMARAHRIGQTKAVSVYRFLTAKTYEMHMFHGASMKLGLDRAVLAHQRQTGGEADQNLAKNKSKSEKEIQAKEIDELLKKGAYDVFKDDDDKEAQKFMDSDIDQLLERSSKTVTYGSTNTSISSGLGSFSKASFVTADADGKDIDLDDPDFWEKAIGLDASIDSHFDENLQLGDGKRNRKQVQQFDPYTAFHEAEQKKKDRIAQKLKDEKEEKQRVRSKERKRKAEEKERRQKQREESRSAKNKTSLFSKRKDVCCNDFMFKERKPNRDTKSKKMKKLEQKKSSKTLEEGGIVVDQMKQAWERSHRDRVVNASKKFGFGRICKIRSESNLISLPIQDVEIFCRAYMFQLGLQASFSLLNHNSKKTNLLSDLRNIISIFGDVDGAWVMNAMLSSLKLYKKIQSGVKSLRMPQILVKDNFITQLRRGDAALSLKQISFLTRLNCMMQCALDQILGDLGYEELGKRGCHSKDLSLLDIDLKARHATMEELVHVIGSYLRENWKDKELCCWKPTSWWDRICDIGLIIGTFVHGLGNYEAMQRDEDLPFFTKTIKFKETNTSYIYAYQNFFSAVDAARNTFDEALISSRSKHSSDIISKVDDAIDAEKRNDLSSEYTVSLVELSESVRIMNRSIEIDTVKDIELRSLSIDKNIPMADPELLDRRLSEVLCLIENRSVSNIKSPIRVLEPQQTVQIEEGLKLFSLINSIKDVANRLMKTLGVTDNLGMTLKNSHYKISDNHSSGYEIYFPIGAVSASITGVGVPTLLTHYGIAALIYADSDMLEKVVHATTTKSIVLQNDSKVDTPLDKHVDLSDISTTSPIISNSEHHDFHSVFLKRSYGVIRAGIFAGVLFCGLPIITSHNSSNKLNEKLKSLCMPNSSIISLEFFGLSKLLDVVGVMANSNVKLDGDEIVAYVYQLLVPHCIQLCLSSNVAVCHNSDQEEGAYSPFPDPLIPLHMHSTFAIATGLSLLRRIKLTTTIQFFVGGGISVDEIIIFLKTSTMRNNVDGIPFWWCPWIHDLALLVHAALFGLFSIVNDRKNDRKMVQLGSVFAKVEIETHLRSLLFHGIENKKPLLSSTVQLDASSSQLKAFLGAHVNKFPSALVIEHRLGFICGQLSKRICQREKNKVSSRYSFLDLPMFDQWTTPGFQELSP